MGTPALLFDDKGEKRYEQQLNIYGGVAAADGWREDMQFRYPGQYEDLETGLRYNRFRYYDAEEGVYLSQDPIGLAGGNPTLYGYVGDVNSVIDPLGLTGYSKVTWQAPSTNIGGAGHNYTVYQQKINWDLPVNTSDGVKTNLDLAAEGRSPFLVKDGKYNQINLHHSRQSAKGPLFELSRATHQTHGRKGALHPHLPAGHPHFPVDRDAFNADRVAYWKERADVEIRRKNKC